MRHPLLAIPEFSNLHSGRGLVRIPMELDVPFTPRVRALVDTAEFQRLRQITQLGLAARVYPGATHTRFEHALGVYHNALRYAWQLARDPRCHALLDEHAAELLLVSALLHDIGHWPFCHPIEDMALPDLPPHEEFAACFLHSSELSGVLRQDWGIEPDEVLEVLVGQSTRPTLKLLRSILSGPIDIDKMDYLDRDSLHAGVPYGRNFDRNRLIQSLVLNQAGDGLAITAKGKTAAELMVFARYVMFSEVYWHHAVRSATCMFANGFYGLHRNFELREFFRKSESETVLALRNAARGTACERLLEGVFGPRRKLYKRVGEYSLYQSPLVYQHVARRPFSVLVRCQQILAERLSARWKRPFAATDVLLDAPPPHREVEFNVDIFYAKENVYRPLASVSPVVDALARTQFDDYVKRVRVFAHPDLAALLTEHVDFTDELVEAMGQADQSA